MQFTLKSVHYDNKSKFYCPEHTRHRKCVPIKNLFVIASVNKYNFDRLVCVDPNS